MVEMTIKEMFQKKKIQFSFEAWNKHSESIKSVHEGSPQGLYLS